MAIHHCVLIRFRDGTTDAQKQAMFNRYQSLAEDCGGEAAGIRYFKVGWNLDPRKCELVQVAVYRDAEALNAYRAHPRHVELTDVLREQADWWVGDLPIDWQIS